MLDTALEGESMTTRTWTDTDTQRALEIWREYQRHHDVSALHGKAVGIDIVSGRVWFGETAGEVADAARAEGVDTSNMLGIRVGYDYYLKKVGKRVLKSW
jgi:hypothetical protein